MAMIKIHTVILVIMAMAGLDESGYGNADATTLLIALGKKAETERGLLWIFA